jgi:hypothetical protein
VKKFAKTGLLILLTITSLSCSKLTRRSVYRVNMKQCVFDFLDRDVAPNVALKICEKLYARKGESK